MQKTIFLLALVLLCVQVQAQFVVKGKVLDETGEGVILANIAAYKNSTLLAGTQTDFDGNFELSLSDSLVVLEVSYTGAQSKKVELKGKKYIEITLSSSINLEEVIVTSYKVPLIEQDNTTQGTTITNPRNFPKRTRERTSRRKRTKNAPSSNQVYYSKQANPSHKNTAYARTYSRQQAIRIVEPETETYDLINENRFYKSSAEPQSTFSIDVDAASYSNLRRFLNNNQKPPADAVRIEEMINYFNYDYPEPQGEHPFEVITEVAECPWQKKHKLLHIGLQGKKIKTESLPPSNLVFLVDVSGSMSNSNKLPLLKSSFELLVEQMRPQDRVALVVYAGAAGVVLPSTSGKEKAKILAALKGLKSGGSTAGGQGIQLAYKLAKENFMEQGNNRIILATDGDFNVGMSNDNDLVRLIEEKRESGVFLTVLGFGMGNYKDSKMQKLANKGNGNHAYIDGLEEAKKVLVSEFGGTMFTIAKDVKIQIEFNPTQVAGYRLIGYENRLLENEDFEDDTKDAGELGAGHTVTALYEIIPKGVKSNFLKSKPKLKYQKEKIKKNAASSKELATVALRYKEASGSTSRLLEQVIPNTERTTENASDNFRFSAAVAEFGMLLRASEFKGTASYAQALELAKKAKGSDEQAYRAGFIKLVKQAQNIEHKEGLGKH